MTRRRRRRAVLVPARIELPDGAYVDIPIIRASPAAESAAESVAEPVTEPDPPDDPPEDPLVAGVMPRVSGLIHAVLANTSAHLPAPIWDMAAIDASLERELTAPFRAPSTAEINDLGEADLPGDDTHTQTILRQRADDQAEDIIRDALRDQPQEQARSESRPETETETQPEARPPAIPAWEIEPIYSAPGFNIDDPWPSYRREMERWHTSGATIETFHPIELSWVIRYRLDPETGDLHQWDLNDLQQVQLFQSHPPPPAQPKTAKDYRCVDQPLRGKLVWRLARIIADAINARTSQDDGKYQAREVSFRALNDHLEPVVKCLRRRLAAASLGMRFYKKDWEDELHTAILGLAVRASASRVQIINGPPTRTGAVAVDPRDIFRQLRQLAVEFGELTVNFDTRTIGVIVPDIVIRDNDTQVDVPLGSFRVTYSYTRLESRDPPVDGFHAEPLQPRYPLVDPYGKRGTTHPHVRSGAICLGAAVNPVLAALKDGRLFDAFLIVRSVLTAYGANAKPYSAPWQWVYTDAEYYRVMEERRRARMRGEAPALPPVRRPADDVDDVDDDDGPRCPGCERYDDECTCRTCSNCGGTYDADDEGGTCRECDEPYCGDCGGLCDCAGCGRERCSNCAYSCEDCSNSHVCSDCRVICKNGRCNKNICVGCSRECEVCDHKFCQECMSSCNSCDRDMCSGCLEGHGEHCAGCGERRCGDRLTTCHACAGALCEDCRVMPAQGLHHVCPGCVVTCAGCQREFGRDEIVLDGLCPGCFNREARINHARRQFVREHAEVRDDLRLRPGESLLLGFLPDGEFSRADALAHDGGMRGRPGTVQDHTQLRRDRQPEVGDRDGDLPVDRPRESGAGGAGPPGLLDAAADRPAAPAPPPAETGRERCFYRRNADGRPLYAWIYPGLPLFNLDPPGEGEAA
jgi:hypothetical protein